MKATMLLADAAHVTAHKLYIWGGGWSVMGPSPTPMAVVIKFEVAWHQAEQDHAWELSLVDADGRPVLCAEHGDHPIRHHGHFHAHRPPHAPPGVALDVPLVVDAGLVVVAPGARYVWHLSVDGASDEDWQLAFTSRPAGPS